jgi:hypothetical protein
MSEFMDELKAARLAVWAEEPQETKELVDPSKGYTDTWDSTFFPSMYAWLETVASRNVLYVTRKALLTRDLDLETVKQMLEDILAMYVSFIQWANLPETSELLQKASESVSDLNSKEEVIEMLEELVLYLSKLNYRIEPHMPWTEMIQAYKIATAKD